MDLADTSTESRPLPPHRLHCYGCGPENPAALDLRFERTDEGVGAHVAFGDRQMGAPGYAHGGAIATAFDETFATLLLAVVQEVGVTARIEVDYRQPVHLNQPLWISARVERREGRKVQTIGVLLDGETILAQAASLFVLVELDHFPLGSPFADTSTP
jgi:acyl-coenzyme A thioesterase PaaI-like protein